MTLNGRVIGAPGLQHILLAAHRSGIRRIVIPGESQQDVYDLPPDLTNDIAIIPVGRCRTGYSGGPGKAAAIGFEP